MYQNSKLPCTYGVEYEIHKLFELTPIWTQVGKSTSNKCFMLKTLMKIQGNDLKVTIVLDTPLLTLSSSYEEEKTQKKLFNLFLVCITFCLHSKHDAFSENKNKRQCETKDFLSFKL